MSDEDLMTAFARGCGPGDGARPGSRQEAGEALEELFGRYKQPLYGFFRRRTGDAGRSEELVQECFVALLQAGGRYRATATFRTFLYAIGLNLLRADRRKTVFRAMFHGEAKNEAGSEPGTELNVLVRDALGRLDRVDREMLMLREYEQLSYDEIAAVLELPVGTVRSRLYRARAALRDVWTAEPVKRVGGVVGQLKEEGRA